MLTRIRNLRDTLTATIILVDLMARDEVVRDTILAAHNKTK